MAGNNNKEKRNVGRPKSDNPKMKFDLRLKTSTILDIELIIKDAENYEERKNILQTQHSH